MMQDKIEQFTVTDIEKTSPTLGQIIAYIDGEIPEGWLPCDGRMLWRYDYPELFKTISTTYGDGDGSNTAFNLPNMVSSQSDIRHIIFADIVN
jgi:microcystin-dependent protein